MSLAENTWDRFATLIALLDMVQFEGLKFYKLARAIAQLEAAIRALSDSDNNKERIGEDGRAVQVRRFKRYRVLLKACGLKYSVKSVDRTLRLLQRPDLPSYGHLRAGLRDLHNHIYEELE